MWGINRYSCFVLFRRYILSIDLKGEVTPDSDSDNIDDCGVSYVDRELMEMSIDRAGRVRVDVEVVIRLALEIKSLTEQTDKVGISCEADTCSSCKTNTVQQQSNT